MRRRSIVLLLVLVLCAVELPALAVVGAQSKDDATQPSSWLCASCERDSWVLSRSLCHRRIACQYLPIRCNLARR